MDEKGEGVSALALVAGAPKKLALLMLAHLLAPLLDHVAHGPPRASKKSGPKRGDEYCLSAVKSTPEPSALHTPGRRSSRERRDDVEGSRAWHAGDRSNCQIRNGSRADEDSSCVRFRRKPNQRLTRFLRCRKPNTGCRRTPRRARSLRIASLPGSIISPRRR